MSMHLSNKARLGVFLLMVAMVAAGCAASAGNEVFWGKTTPPERNVLRYVTGDEPESLDPPVSTGQPEARLSMALFEGLVEYDIKTLEPQPALAERWESNRDSSEFVFHLRHNARWSNGEPITAKDFLYSIRRNLAPEFASRNAYLAFYIKYAQEFGTAQAFIHDPKSNTFLLAADFAEPSPDGTVPPTSLTQKPTTVEAEYPAIAEEPTPDRDTPFHQFIHSPQRLTLPADEAARNKLLAKNEKLRTAVAGKEFVKVTPDDVGIEAVDDFTVRITLAQSAPYFVGLLAHQFFRLVPRQAIETYGNNWTQPGHIVTCGPFKLKSWRPYHDIVVERDPMYWDAATVKLDEIHFYPMTENPTIMNLYKVGEVDAVLNHTVPNAWMDVVRGKKDYMDAVEAAIDYIQINVTKPPMTDVRVRKAFNAAIDKKAWAAWRRIVKPLTAFTPTGIFKGYPQPQGDQFDPARARQLLGEAGFPVTPKGPGWECPSFPIAQVELMYNTQGSNKDLAEFMQAQWKQNLGITVQLRNMETKTFLNARSRLEYKGFARAGWSADYMDPFTFLSLFYTGGESGTGWFDPKFIAMVDEANRTLDKQKRYDLLALAEKYMLDAQPVIPLDTAAVNWVKKPYVKGMYPNPGSLFAWKYVYIERDPAKWDYATPSLAE
ncbi:MAG: oligopeptide transport system substrate-binding protein [Blastocatellia bacterium]|jgi:oligopeptide transport system substrate-binding protein|nr:oligopeptide transport system substrate-binding protein [Blastocatellia bacterium]